MKICFILVVLYSLTSRSEIVKPEQVFKLEQILKFGPEQKIDFGNLKHRWFQHSGSKTSGVAKILYSDKGLTFTLFIQYRNQVISDLFIVFPSFYHHDPILKKLIQKFGKAKSYKIRERTALYIFEKEKLGADYSAECAFNCFPKTLGIYSIPKGQKPLVESWK